MTEATIHLRVPAEIKSRWVRASQAQSQKLTEWVVDNVELGSQNTLATAKSMLAWAGRRGEPFYMIPPVDLEAVRAAAVAMLRPLAMSSHPGWGEACMILSHELMESPEEGDVWMTDDARFFFAHAAALGYPPAVESLPHADEKTLALVDRLRHQYEFSGI